MRGYTAKKGKTWYAVIYEGVDPATGKEKRSWHKAGTRKDDAERLVTDLVKRRNDGEKVSSDKITFGAFLTDRWLPIQEAQLRRSTYDSYRRSIDLHVVPAVGHLRLQHLEPDDLDLFYAHLLRKGRKTRKPGQAGLSPKTIRNIHLMLHKALADAHRKGLVVRNVASLADAPKLSSRKRPEMRVWTASQLRRFLKAAKDRRHYPAFYLAAHTGMRRGEVLGLRWKDVDLGASRLSVRATVISVGSDVEGSDVKTSTGLRTIDLDAGTVELLRGWRQQQASDRLPSSEMVERWGDLAFHKPGGKGEPIHPDVFSQAFERVVASTDLPAIRLHDLRHTHASLLLKAGVPVKVVSERLGHANAAFTMTVYQHVIPGMQAEAANTFARLLHETDPTLGERNSDHIS
jgi:integrase